MTGRMTGQDGARSRGEGQGITATLMDKGKGLESQGIQIVLLRGQGRLPAPGLVALVKETHRDRRCVVLPSAHSSC